MADTTPPLAPMEAVTDLKQAVAALQGVFPLTLSDLGDVRVDLSAGREGDFAVFRLQEGRLVLAFTPSGAGAYSLTLNLAGPQAAPVVVRNRTLGRTLATPTLLTNGFVVTGVEYGHAIEFAPGAVEGYVTPSVQTVTVRESRDVTVTYVADSVQAQVVWHEDGSFSIVGTEVITHEDGSVSYPNLTYHYDTDGSVVWEV